MFSNLSNVRPEILNFIHTTHLSKTFKTKNQQSHHPNDQSLMCSNPKQRCTNHITLTSPFPIYTTIISIGLNQQLTVNILYIRNAHIYLLLPINDIVLTITTLETYPYPIYNMNHSKNSQVNYTVEYPYFFVDKSPI